MMCPRATDMIGEIATAIANGLTAEQMSFLPDSQQASSLFALDANAMAAQNKVSPIAGKTLMLVPNILLRRAIHLQRI